MKINPITVSDILRYYVSYYDVERDILEKFKSAKREDRIKALQSYMNYMKIRRNFSAGQENNIITITENLYFENSRDIDDLSNRYFKYNVLNNRIQNAKVAASKLLWLYNPSIVIMDNLNLKVLGLKTNDYSIYEREWFKVYTEVLPTIEQIIEEFNLEKIDKVIIEDWFKMRVLDQYLWTIGSKI